MRRNIALVVLGVGALVGCSTAPSAPTTQLDALGRQLARTLCPASSSTFAPVANLHVPGQVDQIETRKCSNGTASRYIGQSTSERSGLALRVEVVASGTGLPTYLEIGQPVARALAMLGPPEFRSHGVLNYYLDDDGPGSITINIRNDRITSVDWVWDID